MAASGLVSRSSAPLSMMARWYSPLRGGHRHQRGDLASAAGLAEDRDQIGITAEARDIVANPLESGDNVQHAGGAGEGEIRAGLLREVGESEDVEAVVDGDDDDILGSGEAGSVG